MWYLHCLPPSMCIWTMTVAGAFSVIVAMSEAAPGIAVLHVVVISSHLFFFVESCPVCAVNYMSCLLPCLLLYIIAD